VDRIAEALERAPAGLHDLGEPTVDVPMDWPPGLADVYFAFDGARLFNESIVIYPASQVERDDDSWVVGDIDGDEVRVDARGRVWRTDELTGDRVMDGTSFDRWLHGAIDAEGLLYDGDGEFADDAFDDDGELTPEIAQARLRAQLKRDSKATGPRWRLARLVAQRGEPDRARSELEEVVASMPEFPWAWHDLARLSEELGELAGAFDEAVAAAEAATRIGHDQTGYFWAQAARVAARQGEDGQRARCAAKAVAADAGLVRAQISGAEQNLADGDVASARGLVELARAVAPKDLQAVDLARRIERAAEERRGEEDEGQGQGQGQGQGDGEEDVDVDSDDHTLN